MKVVVGVAAIVAVVIAVTLMAIHVTAASSQARPPVAYGFDGNTGWSRGEVKPHAIYFGVGGNLLIRRLSWASWTQNTAAGRGIRWSDRCLPTCAAGRYIKVPVAASLSRVRIRHGVRYFSRMTLRWTMDGKHYKSIYGWSRGTEFDTSPFWS